MRHRYRYRGFRWLKGRLQCNWMPLVLGIIMTIAVFGLWQQLLVREQFHIQQLVQQEAIAIESKLNRELSTRILTLERMASRWQVSGGTPKVLWENDAANDIAHFYGYQAIEWVDPSFHVRWVVPLKGNEAAQNLDLSQEPRRRITLNIARDLHQTILTRTVSLAQGGKGFLAVVPLYVNDDSSRPHAERFDGFIIGVFRFQALFDSILETIPQYQVQIFDGNGLIYGQGTPLSTAQSETRVVQAYGADWQVQVFPTPAWLSKERSSLPNLVLSSGLLSSWALALVVHLGQRAERFIRQARKINQQLQAEIAEREQIEVSLRRSEASNRNLSDRLNLAVQSAQIGIWDWDIIQDHLVWNEQMYRLYGLDLSDFSGVYEAWSTALHPDDFTLATTAIQQAIRGEKDYQPEFRVIHPDGAIRYIQAYAVVQRDALGQAQRMIGVNFDISDRKQAELALQNSQARFAGILEIASDAIITVNSNQEITLFNKGAERIFGYQAEEMLGQPLSILMPDRFAQLHHHHVNQYAKSDSKARPMAQRGTIFGRRKDGTEFPAEASISKLTLNGEITFTTFLRDITERQQAESAISHLAAIIESSEDAIISKSLNGIITSWNASAERLFGYTAAEIVGQPIADLIPDKFLDEETAILEQIRSGQAIRSYDTQRRRKDGSLVDVSISISPIKDAEGKITGASKIARDISERIQLEKQRLQAEQALRESEERFQSFMRHSPAIAWITDANGVVLYLNQTYLHTFQVPEDFVGKSIFDLFPSDIAQPLIDNIQTVAHTQQALEAIEIAPRQDGSMGNFLVYKFPIPDISGQTLVGGMAIDRTQQYQAEAALQESEERLQLALEASGDGLWDWNIETGDVYYSPQYMTMLGYEADELPHNFETWKYLTHPDDQAWVLDILNAHMRDSLKQYSFDYRVRTKSGSWKWIADYGKVVTCDSQGNPLRMIGTHQDISDRKQAETELKHQKDMLQVIVNHIPVMLALFNAEGRIEFVNPEFEQVLGWSLADWQQEDMLLKCYPDPAYYRTVIEHMVAVNGSWKDFTTLTKTGQAIETSWTNVQLSNGSNLGIGQDISDRKRKETALKQAMEAAEAANLAKSMFLANMSHELRTPLNVILGFAQVMAHDSSLTPNQREDLQTIQRSGDHLLSLINDVLDLSKIEAGHCVLEETGFDLIAMLHGLRTMMTERAKAKQLQLTVDIAPEVPQFVIADEQKLRQILLNLLSNAIKFTDQGSIALRVTSQEAQDKTCLSFRPCQNGQESISTVSNVAYLLQFDVTDTGIGIAASELDTVFDAFVQAEAGRKSISGTGLGLTISRKLLGLMHGTIAVHSAPNVGTTFTVTVPMCPTAGIDIQSDNCDRTVIGLVPGQPHHRILVVDDQRENRLVIVRLLTQLGLEVQEAASGQEAIQIWQEWQPDLTWMDIRMPGVDGYETTRQIRAMEQDQASIIIALTAQASHSDRTLAMAAGCNDYISKPFREKTIFLKLSEYLGLEYVYARANPLNGTSTAPPNLSPNPPQNLTAPIPLPPVDLSTLPPAWLSELEEAAACGNDRGILTLVAQLPSELIDLANYLTHLANQCQFEQILHVLPHPASS